MTHIWKSHNNPKQSEKKKEESTPDLKLDQVGLSVSAITPPSVYLELFKSDLLIEVSF